MTKSRDVLHDIQLLRDLAIVNARTQAELGPLPPGGLSGEPKRKPKPWHPTAQTIQKPENDAMKLSHAAAVATLSVASTLAACGMDGTSQESNVMLPQQEVQPPPTPAIAAPTAQKQSLEPPLGTAPSNFQDSSGDNLEALIPKAASILISQASDLNRDGRMDAVIVVDPVHSGSEMLGEGSARIVMLLIRDATGQLHNLKQNDALVPCEQCGGLAGDPFGYVQAKNDTFTIAIGGGSRERWWAEYTFSYAPDLEDWLLHKIERGVSDQFSDKKKLETLGPKDFGRMRFADFDPSRLPDLILQ